MWPREEAALKMLAENAAWGSVCAETVQKCLRPKKISRGGAKPPRSAHYARFRMLAVQNRLLTAGLSV